MGIDVKSAVLNKLKISSGVEILRFTYWVVLCPSSGLGEYMMLDRK